MSYVEEAFVVSDWHPLGTIKCKLKWTNHSWRLWMSWLSDRTHQPIVSPHWMSVKGMLVLCVCSSMCHWCGLLTSWWQWHIKMLKCKEMHGHCEFYSFSLVKCSNRFCTKFSGSKLTAFITSKQCTVCASLETVKNKVMSNWEEEQKLKMSWHTVKTTAYNIKLLHWRWQRNASWKHCFYVCKSWMDG